jgi:hypothetical protein
MQASQPKVAEDLCSYIYLSMSPYARLAPGSRGCSSTDVLL